MPQMTRVELLPDGGSHWTVTDDEGRILQEFDVTAEENAAAREALKK